MKLAYFYIPNGTTTISYNSEIILDNYTINECYWNKLKPVDSSCRFNIPFNQTIADVLKTHADEKIKVVVKDDTETYFTGYLDDSLTFSKTSRNQPIAIEVVSPSVLLDKELESGAKKESQTLLQLINFLLLQAGFISEEKTLADYSTCDYTATKLAETIDIAIFDEDDNIKTLLTDLCFECGCVFNFNKTGNFKLYPLFNDIGTITQTFTDSNMKSEFELSKKETECDNVCGKWTTKKYLSNALIFSDTQNATDTDKCQITIDAGDYLFGEETNYCEYDNENGSVLWADSASLVTQGVDASSFTTENLGTKLSVSYKNNTTSTQTITQFDVYGNAWIEVEGENLSKATTGENTKDFTFKYINDSDKANELVANILNYYLYSDFTGTVKSFDDFAIGSFVTVTTDGIGTINARIIQKKTTPNKAIEYKLEAVTEYETKTIDTKKYRVSATNGKVFDLINAQATKVSKLFNTRTISIYRESASVLSSDDLPTSILTFNFDSEKPTWNTPDEGYPLLSNGWSWTYPTDATNTVYVTQATAQSQSNTATIQPASWPSPIPSGQDGTNGMNSYTVTLYVRTNDAPSFLPNELTYNFKTGALVGTKNGWNQSIPAVDDDGNPCWEIHATALSEGDTDTIESSEWSVPVQITSDGITKAEVKEIVQEEISDVVETPNVYADYNSFNILVNSKGKTTHAQEVDITVHVLQLNEEIDFQFDTETLSNVLPSGFSFSINYHTLTIKVSEGVKISCGSFTVPIICKVYKYNNELGWTIDGEITTIADDAGDVLGYKTYYDDESTFDVGISYQAVKSGTYKGVVTSLDTIPSDVVIGDYFTWVAEDTASTLSQTGQFKQCAIYFYIGDKSSYQWELDDDSEHLASAMSDVLSIANADLETNNSEAYEYIGHLTANTIFAKMIVANSAFIDQLTTNETFVDALTANEAFIEKIVANEAFIEKIESSGILAEYAKLDELDAEHINAEGLKVESGIFNSCSATELSVVKGTFTQASVDGSLTGNYVSGSKGYKLNASDGSAEFNGNVHIGGTTTIDGSATLAASASIQGNIINGAITAKSLKFLARNYTGRILDWECFYATGDAWQDSSGYWHKPGYLKYFTSAKVRIYMVIELAGNVSTPYYSGGTFYYPLEYSLSNFSYYISTTESDYSELYVSNLPIQTSSYDPDTIFYGQYGRIFVDSNGYLKMIRTTNVIN